LAILVDAGSRIVIQGITGSTGRSYAQRMIAAGTPLVAGVSPGKGGEVVAGVPVFDSMADAVAHTGANAALCVIRDALALGAVLEAVSAGIATLVLYTEGVPVHDAIRMRAYARARGARLLGPNSAGVISPGKANLADLNDAVLGTTYADILPLFEADAETDLVVLIGEPGGRLEYEAIAALGTMRKPVVAYIAAQNAPPEKRMGHAGAIYGGDQDDTTAAAKLAAFQAAGCEAVGRVTQVGAAVRRALNAL
jgi:succinyl-CoA synthetase alpha subunit